MTSQSSIMEKKNTPLDERIHISPKCVMHLHGHWNKVVTLMKPFILTDLSNGVKFCSCTYCSTNDIRSHYLPHWVNNHHIGNENLICCNPTFGLATKARACKDVGQEGSLGVTFYALESVGKCEESRWSPEFSENDYIGQNPLD
jgi:hypothetical protein